MQRRAIAMGITIPLVILWGLAQLAAEALENPLPAPAPLVPELSLENPFADLPVYCMSGNAPLIRKGTEMPAGQVLSAIPLSDILNLFGFIDYTVCDKNSGVMPYDGAGGYVLPQDWYYHKA